MSRQQVDALVVGAGIAGLACATALADAGLRVAVLEARAAGGGRARSWTDAATGLEVDIGPHVVSTEHRNFLQLLRRLGTEDRIAWQPDPLIDLLDAGEVLRMRNVPWPPPWHGLPDLPVALRRLGWGDLLSHLRVAWQAMRANEQTLRAIDGQDALTWLRGLGVSERSITWFWRSALLALLNVPLEHCSAASALRVFRLMVGRSGYHFGFPMVGLSELYVPQSEALVRAAGGAVHTGIAVRRLLVDGGTAQGVELRDGTQLRAPLSVLAVAPPQARALLARSRIAPLQALERSAGALAGAPYQCTYLWFDRPVTHQRFWARVWERDGLNTDFYDLSHIRPALAGGGSVIACNAIGPQVRPDWSDAQVVARCLEELADFSLAAAGARLLHARVHRLRMAIPQPRPGMESLRPANATAVGGLFVAGDWTDTAVPCSMESAARSGLLAAGAILGRALALPAPETYGLPGWLRRRTGPVPPERRTAP